MITQSISEARRKLGELIDLARQGEDVVIIKDSKPVAALTPIDASDLEVVRITPSQEKRIIDWAKSQPGVTFPSTSAAVKYLKREFRKKR
jgi:prevent-host-death family protein